MEIFFDLAVADNHLHDHGQTSTDNGATYLPTVFQPLKAKLAL